MSVDVQYIANIYSKLTEMDIQLDTDPIEYGPSRLNQKTAHLRTFLSQTEKIFMEVSHNLHKYKRDLLISETQYEVEKNRLMAEDPHVRSGRSQGERESLASTKLVDIQSKINDCRLAVHDLEDVMKVIKAKRTDLKDLQGRLRDQLKLCQEQIALGQRWGSKADQQVFDTISAGHDVSESDVLIKADASLRNEEPLPWDEQTTEAPSISSSPTTDQIVDDLLEKATTKNVTTEMKSQATEGDIEGFMETPLTRISQKSVDDFDLDSLFDEFSS